MGQRGPSPTPSAVLKLRGTYRSIAVAVNRRRINRLPSVRAGWMKQPKKRGHSSFLN